MPDRRRVHAAGPSVGPSDAVPGAIAAALRAVLAVLPVFGDDYDVGMEKG